MEYLSFTIENYKAITNKVDINLKNKLIPIIGINECGKTTILQAIYAFDYLNDNLFNKKHITNIKNNHNLSNNNPAKITASLKLQKDTLTEIINNIYTKKKTSKITKLYDIQEVSITRTIEHSGNTKYIINDDSFKVIDKQEEFAKAIIQKLPYILYFDDFNDSIPETITVSKKQIQDNNLNTWVEIIQEIFKQAGVASEKTPYTLNQFITNNDNTKRTIKARVDKLIGNYITDSWNKFSFNDKQEDKKITISLDYRIIEDKKESSIIFTFKVVDTNNNNDDSFFELKERSKGFYWFVNFIMKLKFNTKYRDLQKGAIFLLDEPGSYLHAEAQNKLAAKLQDLSRDNIVIYCTHSNYLLSPEYIKTSYIQIASKIDSNIILEKISDYKTNMNSTPLAPVYQVLGLNYEIFNNINKKIIIVEGINDFYFLSLVKHNNISFLPSTSSNHIHYLVPLFLSAGKEFICLLDGDKAGRKAKDDLKDLFGKDIRVLTIKDILPESKKPEQIISKQDIQTLVSEFNLGNDFNTDKDDNIKKLFSKLYYSENKEELLNNKIPDTRNKIIKILDTLSNNYKIQEIVDINNVEF